MKPKINLYLFSRSPHISMIISGFVMLEKQNLISLNVIPNYHRMKKYPHPHIVEAVTDGKRIVYDCWDLCNWTAADWDTNLWKNLDFTEFLMSETDFYFKRSFSNEKNACLSENSQKKLYPLGFNFHVSVPNNPIDHYNFLSPQWCKKTVKRLFFSNLASKNNADWTIDKFENPPKFVDRNNLKILFLTRLYDPFGKDVWNEEKRLEREQINTARIDIIESLKHSFPNSFIGGIEPCGFVNERAKKHLVSNEISNRYNYVNLMKISDICIGSMGLHESIGRKTGEYVAASKAIVNEKFHYEIPYGFEEQKNYSPFETPEQCVFAVSELMKNPEKVFQQKQENDRYYKSFLRPDQQILNTLKIAKII